VKIAFCFQKASSNPPKTKKGQGRSFPRRRE
jgi:hypothetical protein